jgi:hypothetical protein
MGLVLDSGVLIAAERDARPVSELLASLEYEHGETEIVLSSITVIELEHGLHCPQTIVQARQRREHLDTVFAAVSRWQCAVLPSHSPVRHRDPSFLRRETACPTIRPERVQSRQQALPRAH